ncbi:hypothetical protein [Lentzea alba]|uniref:hypothetical protein n=1 Tax=Lentzea alba TaxID=2714351 RepID=UPI0028BD86D2|nr:hypothetical protein [Lentzea alba]
MAVTETVEEPAAVGVPEMVSVPELIDRPVADRWRTRCAARCRRSRTVEPDCS